MLFSPWPPASMYAISWNLGPDGFRDLPMATQPAVHAPSLGMLM